MSVLNRRNAVVVFLAFAFAYFFSALLRAVTATLAPTLTDEFALSARDLGLLGGGFFFGFAITQLPLGTWLDRHGPKKVILSFVLVAVAGCLTFAAAQGFTGLLLARFLCGIGVSACLMAPLTGYRRWLDAGGQLRANSWMLMTGSLGMVASTLPVQWLLPVTGWRVMFVGLAVLLALSMLVLAWKVPGWDLTEHHAEPPSYALVWKHAYFRRMAPLGFFNYGGLLAIQTLWAGPWLVSVTGYDATRAAAGLFTIHVCMLVTFWCWGLVNPVLSRRGIDANRLITWGVPINLVTMAAIIVAGPSAGEAAWALFCMTCTFVSLSQPAVGMAFPSALAGRALSAYNLVIFAGVFAIQWGIGLLVDGFGALGLSVVGSYRAAFGVFLASITFAYAWFLLGTRDNPVEARRAAP
jgi:MFS family permease